MYTPKNIDYFYISGKILASALLLAKKALRPGITTLEIDKKIHACILNNGGVPSFIGLEDYKFASCLSINNQIVHTPPSNQVLYKGDMLTIDIGVSYNGCCTDAARTYVIGTPTSKQSSIIYTANKALVAGIEAAKIGNRVGSISFAVQKCIESRGYRSPLEFGGHGIGFKPHSEPFIPNSGPRNSGIKLHLGMLLAIEPIVMCGDIDILVDKNNVFSYVSADGNISAHAENTVLIKKEGPHILTDTTLGGIKV